MTYIVYGMIALIDDAVFLVINAARGEPDAVAILIFGASLIGWYPATLLCRAALRAARGLRRSVPSRVK